MKPKQLNNWIDLRATYRVSFFDRFLLVTACHYLNSGITQLLFFLIKKLSSSPFSNGKNNCQRV